MKTVGLSTHRDNIRKWGEETTPLRRMVHCSRRAVVFALPEWRAETLLSNFLREMTERGRREKIAVIHAAAVAR